MKPAQKKVSHFYKKQYGLLNDSVKEVLRAQSKKEIHRLRVHIKKMKVVFRLMKLDGLHRSPSFSKRIKKLFKAAGEIRECQVNRKNAEKYLPPGAATKNFISWLSEKEKQGRDEFRKPVKKLKTSKIHHIEKKLEKKLQEAGKKNIKATVKRYIRSESATIKKNLVRMRRQPELLHKTRKHLKAIILLAGFVPSDSKSRQVKKIEDDISDLEKLIGRWHDGEILLFTFREFLRQQKDKTRRQSIKTEQKIIQQNKKMLTEVYAHAEKAGKLLRSN